MRGTLSRMDFTDEERRAWHAARKDNFTDSTDDDGTVAGTCLHCGAAFGHGAGVVTDEAAICDVCNGD